MIVKRKLSKGKVRVTFVMPAIEGVTQLHLVGDFNDWSMAKNPMQMAADGSWTAAVTLDGGREYVFRYLANGADWHNDWSADRYAPNEFGTDNSVVSLAEDAMPRPAAKRTNGKKKL